MALTTEKGGPKFKALDPAVPDSAPQFEIGKGVAHYQTIAQLLKLINDQEVKSGHVVIDGTGLQGRYDIVLQIQGLDPTDPNGMLALVKEQLGLVTVRSDQKSSIQYVVIDDAQIVHGKWVKP